VWEAKVDERRLKFHLVGINNQNFLMRDEETGSWWQQVSGEAIQGPLKGRRLNPVFSDEISFAIWKRETPQGRVLRPDDRFRQGYVSADWEKEIEKLPLVTPVGSAGEFAPRTLIAGLTIKGKAMAYPVADLQRQRLILDNISGVSLFLVVGEDGQSVRAFERAVDDRTLEFFVKADASSLQMTDAETGTTWDFSGKAISGQLAGKQLKKIAVLKDYWFDWKLYHPDTAVYRLGARLNDQ
jgi:hypothetical protein